MTTELLKGSIDFKGVGHQYQTDRRRYDFFAGQLQEMQLQLRKSNDFEASMIAKLEEIVSSFERRADNLRDQYENKI